MRRDHGQRIKIIEREIAIARGVETVCRERAKIPARARSRSRSSGNAQPASAPEPIGQASARAAASCSALGIAQKRLSMRQQENAKTKSAARAACASCRASEFPDGFRLESTKRSISPASAAGISRAASFTNMRKSVATSSLRLRPVCSLCAERPELFDTARFRQNDAHPPLAIRRATLIRAGALCDVLERGQNLRAFIRGKNRAACKRARPHSIDRQLVRQQAAIETRTTARNW